MKRIEKIIVVLILVTLAILCVPAPNVPIFFLASPPANSGATETDVTVFVSGVDSDTTDDRVGVTLTVLNQTGRRVYFRGQFARLTEISPYDTREVDIDCGYGGHCGNCWEDHSLLPGFGTTYKSILHAGEKRGRYGFIFGYNKSGPYDQVSWSEYIRFPTDAR